MSDKYVLDGHDPRRVDDLLEWGRWFETAKRSVACTRLDDDRAIVSTVFLGLDHSFGQGERPILFETMIFAGGVPEINDYQERYATWDEAEEGHARAVEMAHTALGINQ